MPVLSGGDYEWTGKPITLIKSVARGTAPISDGSGCRTWLITRSAGSGSSIKNWRYSATRTTRPDVGPGSEPCALAGSVASTYLLRLYLEEVVIACVCVGWCLFGSGLVYFQKILQNRNSSTFVCIWQILSNYGLTRLQKICQIKTKLYTSKKYHRTLHV